MRSTRLDWPRACLAATGFALAMGAGACGSAPKQLAAPKPVVPSPTLAAATPGESGNGDETDNENADDPNASDEEGAEQATETEGPCAPGMALVDRGGGSSNTRFCVDRYEAALVEVLADGTEQRYPHYLPVDGHTVRAVSEPGVFPQGFISEVQAQDACAASGKRLCSHDEWKTACMGPARTTFPYGDARQPGVCHDTGKSAVVSVFGAAAVASSPVWTPKSKPGKSTKHATAATKQGRSSSSTRAGATSKAPPKTSSKPSSKKRGAPAQTSTRPASVDAGVWTRLNDPRLGQVDGALARTGAHEGCVNGFGVFDMVGNVHEWVATDPTVPHGTFAGGYYLDTALNGDGCGYRTVAHAHDYHDYSTGFRCCADAP